MLKESRAERRARNEYAGIDEPGVLSDRTIRRMLDLGLIAIDPVFDGAIQPSSVDVHLGPSLKMFKRSPTLGERVYRRSGTVIDPRVDISPLMIDVDLRSNESGGEILLPPLSFALGALVEWIDVPDTILCRLDGCSSLGRLGLLIHATAGLVDPGYHGRLTVELFNLSPYPIVLYRDMRIGQISFERMTTPADAPYNGRYQGDADVAASRIGRA